MIQSIQKVIKVGTSAAVTIPAKDLARHNIAVGDNVSITVEPLKEQDNQKALLDEYNKFKAQYSKTLENLSKR
jgi:antitoxin component of MazEF toxin-antitoxin module